MKNICYLLLILPLLTQAQLFKEEQQFTRQDTLRGSITPEREWWDLNYYHLDIEVLPEEKMITGSNLIAFTALKPGRVLQVDLQEPMKIDRVEQEGKALKVESEGNAHFIHLEKVADSGSIQEIRVFYSGHPKEAVRAPWDGGLSWKEDRNDEDFIATSCQGLGASVWWPNKDHMYDEADSMKISVTVPERLVDVSNGRLLGIDHDKINKKRTFHWGVTNPINNYGVNINIGDYVGFGEVYQGEKGPLDMNYYVLSYNLEKAREHFKQAAQTMEAFEHWFGPYPFYEDGYKLVEVPYLGMEHQSSVTYGNGYQNGYRGTDLSGSGWGLKFDFIIVHESGHEWFANNITNIDIADMWIHESFTAYSESLFVEYFHGKEAGADYVTGTRKNILNDKPIIGVYHVNHEGSGDMYYKGANMLHTLRQLVEDDQQWRNILRGLNKDFYHQTVSSAQVEAYLSEKTGKDLSAFFNQYLRDTRIPVFEYELQGNTLRYRYTDIVNGFDMPLEVTLNGHTDWIFPTATWKEMPLTEKVASFTVDRDYLVVSKQL
ncbi:M1 family metallopeptidase [Robertkochia flava]|uniref:M1 family metallopeptidase n=1 Tax=Robertkochia flava TaxID=3447986 RepID=UPI001CCCD476|nr:M1 family metallopeptidase [Robertkochia marina]